MEAATFIVGIVLGGAVVALLVRPRLIAGARDLGYARQEAQRLAGERDSASTRATEAEQSFADLREKLGNEVVALQKELEHEKTDAAQKLKLFEEANERVRTEFKALSGDALRKNNQQFIELAKSEFGTLHSQAEGTLEKRKDAVAELVKPIKESLVKVDGRLEQLERDRHAAGERLSSEMKALVDANERLRTETNSLTMALRQPQTRGRWAELQLRQVVEMVGMTSYCDFVEQKTVEGEAGRLRPDLIVNLPGGKQVVVDAKAPLQCFLDASCAEDEVGRREQLVGHARGLREHMRKLSAKSYWSQFDAAPDFVVLFLPGEHFYSAALEIEPGLIEAGVKQCVLVATPMTLITLLRAVSYGWQQEKVAESARAVSELGRELHSRLSLLVDRVDTLGRRLNSTVGAYNDAVGTLEGRVLPSARRFHEHGAVSAGKELPVPTPVETSARGVQVPELRSGLAEDDEPSARAA